MVLNGDTLFHTDIAMLFSQHLSTGGQATQLAAYQSNQNSGEVKVDLNKGLVVAHDPNYSSKNNSVLSFSSTGSYIFSKKTILAEFPQKCASLEKNIIHGIIAKKNVVCIY